MSTPSRTASELLRDELLHEMGAVGFRVTSRPEERNLVSGQSAAVWFTENRVAGGKRLCVVRRGPDVRDIGFIEDLTPHLPQQTRTSFMPQQPPFRSMAAVARFVLHYLLGDAP